VLQDVASRWASLSLPTDLLDLWQGRGAGSALRPFTNERHPLLLAAIAECAAVQRQDGDFHSDYAAHVAGVVAYYLNRHAGAPVPRARAAKLSTAQMRGVRDHIQDHIDSPVAVATLAAIANMSLGHFFRAFRATTGMAPLAYVQLARVQRAMELLSRPNASVTDTALRVGFSNLGHFSRVFARVTGVLPSSYTRAERP
jgi:AraC family transcriptional regulator